MYTRADERFEAYEEPEQSANNDNEQGIINGLHDSFESDYVNVKNKYAEWSGDHVLMLDLRDQETASSFKSAIGSEHYGAEREWFASSISFHNPSEHTVDGAHFPMEMHLVHTDGDGNYGVLGFLFKVSPGLRRNICHSCSDHKQARSHDGVDRDGPARNQRSWLWVRN